MRSANESAAQEPTGTLTSRIEKLALEELDAVRRRDWSAAKSAAQERAALQEARHRAIARRWT
ncbi:hypothetical protein RxyAA322_13170 [Rubrobacter xylanophilus]|uniref:Uncharacterized protein n=1 Tax=Rubrobacter xylanophilus TaxID=49319 RepID=A0A510HLK2_9ACTN|nr:hypothetical protein [Rubrobacter xylanophilus]BBL79463.1 hypothetical protein RxyAA322_13170 [Rubrobacter xylanophilus]